MERQNHCEAVEEGFVECGKLSCGWFGSQWGRETRRRHSGRARSCSLCVTGVYTPRDDSGRWA